MRALRGIIRHGRTAREPGEATPHPTTPWLPPARRCLPPDTEAAYTAMAKGEDDLKRRRRAGQLKAASVHGKSTEFSRSGGIRRCPAQPVSGETTGFNPFRQA